MSMICNLRRASDDQIATLLSRPEGIRSFLYGPELDAPKPGLLARLFGAARPAPPPVSPCEPPSPDDEIDLDKAWHGLHFLFTGTDWEGEEPLCYLVRGGAQIGNVDVGYDPARALTSAQAKQFHESLSQLTQDVLRSRFDPEQMKSLAIYPDIWDRDPEDDDTLEYLVTYFDELRSFLNETASRQLGLIIYIN